MLPGVASAAPPMSYLQSFGPKADRIAHLTWGMLIISIAVVVVMTALVVWAVFRSRPAIEDKTGADAKPQRVNAFNCCSP